MAKKESHIHKLKRHTYKKSGAVTYFCVLNCTFKIAPELAIGKIVLCNRCGNPFEMTQYTITLKAPHCEKCHKKKNNFIDLSTPVVDVEVKTAPEVISNLRSRMIHKPEETPIAPITVIPVVHKVHYEDIVISDQFDDDIL